MLRKQIIGVPPAAPALVTGPIDIAAVATVLVTSEDPGHPVDHAFDGDRGPGASRWVAGDAGEQVLILAFDAPQAIRRVALEVEEQAAPAPRSSSSPSPTTAGRPCRAMITSLGLW